MRERWMHGRLVVLALLWAGVGAGRSAAEEGTVTGTGTAEVKRLPDVMRMHIAIEAKGKDLKEALARLKERRKSVRASLTDLGAVKETITFGDASLAQKSAGATRVVREFINGRLVTPPKPKSKTPPPVAVTASVHADFPLKASDAEATLLAVHDLQEKIRAADLAGLKDVGKLTPEEEEIAEEMPPRDEESEGPGAGKPIFWFVATVADHDRDKALAEAFQKAKREAGRLAAAAGAGLGPLRQVADVQRSLAEEAYGFRSRSGNDAVIRQVMGDDEKPSEAVGFQPGPVVLRVGISAQFVLKPLAER